MQTDAPGMQPAPANRPASRFLGLRPRALAIPALVASGLAAVLVVGTLVQPAGSALAWDPTPTAATPAQEAAARDACTVPETIPPARIGETETTDGGQVTVSGPSVTGSGAQGEGGTIVQSTGAPIALPQVPTELPPLVYIELHGTGAVAIFADADTTAYCLLVKRGDGFELAGLLMPVGDGVMGVGTVVGATGEGPGAAVTTSGAMIAGEGDFQAIAMATEYGDAKVGIIAGTAPAGAATVEVSGGPADGATSTVADGRFALWAPKALDSATALVARDASGVEIGRVELAAPPTDGRPVPIEIEGLPGGSTPAP